MNLPSDSLNAILQGAVLSYSSGSTMAWTAGVVVINGEILPIAAGSTPYSSGDKFYFHVVSALSGSRTFKDGVSHDCYETRSVTITTVSTNGIDYNTVPRMHSDEDTDYAPSTLFSSTSAAALYRRNGMYYFKMAFSHVDDSQPVSAGARFNITSSKAFENQQISFQQVICFSNGIISAGTVTISIAQTGNNLYQVDVSFTSIVAANPGSASVFFCLPIL